MDHAGKEAAGSNRILFSSGTYQNVTASSSNAFYEAINIVNRIIATSVLINNNVHGHRLVTMKIGTERSWSVLLGAVDRLGHINCRFQF